MTLWHDKRSGIEAFKTALGPKGFTEDQTALQPHLEEWRGKYHGTTQVMLMPSSTKQVQQIMGIASAHHIPLTPQGGNTGLVGASLPGLDGIDSVLISFKRMTAITIDGPSVLAEAGAIIQKVQQAAADKGRLFPLSLASDGSCTVGGTIATNAGGIHVVRFGVMRQLTMGVKAVLADGSIIDETADLVKDNSGYRLSGLLAGSEGTLGLITQARLKTYPAENHHITGWLYIDKINHAASILRQLQDISDGRLGVFEIMSDYALTLARQHIPGAADTLKGAGHLEAPWSILFEIGLSAADIQLQDRIASLLGSSDSVRHAVLATTDTQRRALIAVRESLSEAQKREGISIKHDISLPLDAIPAFLAAGEALAQRQLPGCKPVVFGHLGDGNLHYNLMQPADTRADDMKTVWADIQSGIHDLVHQHGGSLSAEHGIGRMKKADLARLAPARYAAMRRIKQALDPNGILNPGVLF